MKASHSPCNSQCRQHFQSDVESGEHGIVHESKKWKLTKTVITHNLDIDMIIVASAYQERSIKMYN